MKRFALYLGIAAGLVASCSTKEIDFQTPVQDDVVFYASFEQPTEEGTKVYANEDLLLRWTADDRVSIFNKNTYNQQYKFTGETGDNAGGFDKVVGSEFTTGNTISHIVSVYPYQESTKISESETITVTLPAEQRYAENTFGLGANTMVSITSDTFLQYKNVGGYLRVSLYGEGVSVSSITLKGNNGEKLAGKATVTMPLDGVPTVAMSNDATDVITLVCDTPVQLAATAEESTQFWFVVPPVIFSKGFTITISGNGEMFKIATEKTVTIERNNLSKMSPIEVELSQPNNVIYYTSSDGTVVTPYDPDALDASILSNEYVEGLGIITFDGDVMSIGDWTFLNCTRLNSITIPDSVTRIGDYAFYYCTGLTSITIPDSVSSIGDCAFRKCRSLTSITIPDSVTSIGGAAFIDCTGLTSITISDRVTSIRDYLFSNCTSLTSITIPDSVTSIDHDAFQGCTSLTSITIPDSVTRIGDYAFSACKGLTSITIPDSVTSIGNQIFSGCSSLSSITIPDSVTRIGNYVFSNCTSLTSITIPDSVTSIGNHTFSGCSSLTSITIPDSVTSIEGWAFYYCTGLTSITIKPEEPPRGGQEMFVETNNCPIYVPAGSVEVYKTAQYWSEYANRIYAIGTPMAVDLGLSVKWASFNLGATKLEEYGDYYAWGETKPYYSSLDPLVWNERKEAGYELPSYKWCMGSNTTLTKYCNDSSYGYNGFMDGKTFLDPEDDAAHVNLGGAWRMPTDAEWTELREKCTWEWTSMNGINGRKVAGPNGNSIFLPAAGYRNATDLCSDDSHCYYWSSSLNTDRIRPSHALYVRFNSFRVTRDNISRCTGLSIRPVVE